MPLPADATTKRKNFFKLVFRNEKGYIAVGKIDRRKDEPEFDQQFFVYPDDLDLMLDWIDKFTITHDTYYCPNLFETGLRRTKDNVSICTCAWADLDSCTLDELLVPASIGIESSPDRYQALWMFEDAVSPATAEDISRRVAYAHLDSGADKSGWDLTQLLRVPFTYNHKRLDPTTHLPVTTSVISTTRGTYTPDSFDSYPQVKGYEFIDSPMPEELEDAQELLHTKRTRLMPQVFQLMELEPEGDWSKSLWQLQMLLFEAGMTREEVFSVASSAACNKYKRDGKPVELLWKEVCRAFGSYEERHRIVSVARSLDTPLLSDQERIEAQRHNTFVEDYIEWAKTLGDAAWQYHQAGAFICLSSILAGPVRLPTSFGTIVPNMWFMILADTTLTRKTTAMDMAVELITEVDSDAILATDGSIEGLFTALSMRSGRPSVFLRDEFSGLLEQMTKKDYYSGMAETFTKLYDGKFQKRILRKEIIEVRDPVLIMFAGGIRTRILELLTYEHVASGFLPRFVFITAESDVTRLRPLGPPTTASLGDRSRIYGQLVRISNHYRGIQTITVNDRQIAVPRTWEASLTPEAWARYNKFEADMLQLGLAGAHPDITTPSFDRLAKSTLKAAVLLAASYKFDERLEVTEGDIVKAIAFCEHWRDYSIGILENLGKTTQEKELDQIRRAIFRKPGVLRSELMQNFHLSSAKASAILQTLDERGVITVQREARTQRLYPVGTE